MTRNNHAFTVLLLGGYGFIGRHTLSALSQLNAKVIIGTRGKKRAKRYRDAAPARRFEQRNIYLHKALSAEDWYHTLIDIDVVINCVGLLRERHCESFSDVHHRGVAALAIACADKNVPLIHMSALGVSYTTDTYSKSKLLGEQAILGSSCKATIVRASLVDALDGYGASWFHKLAQWPVWPLPAGANKYLSPVKAPDLGEALATLALQAFNSTIAKSTIIEIGCGEWFTLESYLKRLRRPGLHTPMVIRIPQKLAFAVATVCDWFNFTPYTRGHHHLLEFNNVPGNNGLPDILKRNPTPIAPDFPKTVDSQLLKTIHATREI